MPEQADRCKKLWSGVILRAFVDAFHFDIRKPPDKKNKKKYDKVKNRYKNAVEARRWIEESDGLDDICGLLDLNARKIRKQYYRLLEIYNRKPPSVTGIESWLREVSG